MFFIFKQISEEFSDISKMSATVRISKDNRKVRVHVVF